MKRGRQRDIIPPARRGFTLVELVIVVTIIGIVASIAAPRMAGASKHASANALRATLSGVRTAIDCYYAEHGKYPGYVPGTDTPDSARFADQLLMYSNQAGDTAASPGPAYVFGPYLRSPFPKNPTNNLDTVHVKATPADAGPVAGSVGWVAVLSHGYFGISATNERLEKIGITDTEMKIFVRDLAAD